ncbi:unnamed protein product [Pedinophyceae sp. YPF-701]|nr:unnamed protein product [Pedinophyceae sp. YPF-701]
MTQATCGRARTPLAASPRATRPAQRSRTRLAVMRPTDIPIFVLADSYKATHCQQYPEAQRMVAYGEFRRGFEKDVEDTRFVCFGMRYIIENYLLRQWTMQDVEMADAFYKSHLAPGNTAFPWPRDLFERFVRENNGYFPLKVQALPEGTVANARVPVYQITAEGDYSRLVTFLETILTQVWYPSTVATSSRRAKAVIARGFEATVDGGADNPLLSVTLHDFGFRGCATVEQSILGGCAHLLNFRGTDTMSAAFYAQFHLNGGKPVGSSIPATEHSVMTAWPTETEAFRKMISEFGDGMFSVVCDSYDYVHCLERVLPAIAKEKTARGGYMVLRPDSGNPVECVLQALRAMDREFGSTVNSKGCKVVNGGGVIQGDGINTQTIADIVDACVAEKFSLQCVAFGMGGGLLQKVNRDTMSFATKLCHIVGPDGVGRDIMKNPRTDMSKASFPGELKVVRVDGVPTAFPAEAALPPNADGEDLLEVVYDSGPVEGCRLLKEDFDTLIARVEAEWAACPPTYQPVSESLQRKIEARRAELERGMAVAAPE